jgi:hypothetical protein
MNLDQLTNYQLYEIIQNQKLDEKIRSAANVEFNSRKLTKGEIQEIVNQHSLLFRPDSDEPLSLKYKIVALVVPFFWVIHVLMTSRYLARSQKRKWNEYWLFFCIGLFIWTIVIVIVGKYINEK